MILSFNMVMEMILIKRANEVMERLGLTNHYSVQGVENISLSMPEAYERLWMAVYLVIDNFLLIILHKSVWTESSVDRLTVFFQLLLVNKLQLQLPIIFTVFVDSYLIPGTSQQTKQVSDGNKYK
jgi:hypothetical protein